MTQLTVKLYLKFGENNTLTYLNGLKHQNTINERENFALLVKQSRLN